MITAGVIRTPSAELRSISAYQKILWQVLVHQGLPQELSDIADSEPPHQIEAMHFHRSDADLETVCRFAIRKALCDATKYFTLSRRQ
ncbi:hypothetical protein YTPLAS18_09780 [Nitrospira sp.]|nr:hypothetical protein YTPLAS18_09780 [Nitrospira sp.]